MMRKTITRRLTETKIHAVEIVMNGDDVSTKALEPVVVYGNISDLEAKRELNRVHGNTKTIVLKKVESEEKNYQISVEDFVKNAKVVDKAEESEEN